MEIFDTNIKQMLLQNEALRQHILESFCNSPGYRNLKGAVSSLHVETLFKTTSTSSVDYEAVKYIPAKRKDSGDCYTPCLGTHEVNYHKIIIERCNRNKGIMCELCDCEKVEKLINTEQPSKKDHGTEPDTAWNYNRSTSYTKYKTNGQTSKTPIVAGITGQQAENSNTVDDSNVTDTTMYKEEKNGKENKKQKSSGIDTTEDDTRLCIPAILEDVESSLESEKTFGRCKNNACSCQTYDVDEALAKVIKSPPIKTVCMQKKKKKNSFADAKSTESSSCCCEKKKPYKCFCFRKNHKGNSTNDMEKSIQTTGICCSDKCEQISQNEVPVSNSSRDINEYGDQIKTKSCCKCGKSNDKHHKGNKTVTLPNSSSSPISSDQTDTLKTLIKIEAKQNYRQVNIILRELNEQKTEIKKLIELYHSLSKNVSGSKLDKNSVQGFIKKMDYLDDFPCSQRTQTVNICEGCGLHFYRDGFVDSAKTGGIPSASPDGEKVETDEQPRSTSEPQSTIEPRSTSEHRSTSGNDSDKQFKRKASKTNKVKSTSRTKPSKEKIKGEIQKDTVPKKGAPIEPKSPAVSLEDKTLIKQNKQITTDTTSVLTLYKDKNASETSMVTPEKKTETLGVDFKTDASSDTKFSTCKSKSKAFVTWCKKSFMSVKDKESKQLKQCNKFIQSKIKKCKQSCTERPKKSVFTYVLQCCKYFTIFIVLLGSFKVLCNSYGIHITKFN